MRFTPRLRRARSPWSLTLGMLVYALAYLLLYPRTVAIVDENAYLTQAFLLRSGRITYDGSPIPAPHMTVEHSGRLASKYPPGTALFLVPFVLFGWRAAFLSGLLLATAGTWLLWLVLRRLDPEVHPAWSLLYLCYPAVVVFSRTLMSDLLAATAVLAAFYCLLRGHWWLVLSGLALGFALLVRYSNAVLLPVFLLLVARSGSRIRGPLALSAGFAPFFLLALGYNWYCYGGPFSFPMYLTGVFSPVFFPGNLAYYAVNLTLVYPLMLLAPLALRGGRALLGLPALALLLVYCFFSYIAPTTSFAIRMTVGMRYLLPGVPFFIAGFILVVDSFVRRLRGAAFFRVFAVAAVLVAAVALQYRHDDYLRVQESYQARLLHAVPPGARLLCNGAASELVNRAWGWREFHHLAEFSIPVIPWGWLAGSDPLYAALLEKSRNSNPVDRLLFETVVGRSPGRQLVMETTAPYRFRVYRLR